MLFLLSICFWYWALAALVGFLIGLLINWLTSNGKIAALKKEKIALEKDKKNFWSQIQALQTDVHNLELKLRDQEYETSKFKTESDEKSTRIQTLEMQELSLKERLKGLELDYNKTGFDYKSTLGIAGSLGATALTKNKSLSDEIDTLKSQLSGLQTDKESLLTEINQLKKDKAELEEFKIKNAASQEMLKTMRDEKASLLADINRLKGNVSALKFDLKSQQGITSNIVQQSVHELQSKPGESQLQELSDENEALRKRIDALYFDLKSQTALNENIAKEATTLKSNLAEFDALKAQNERLEARIKSLEFDLKSQLALNENIAKEATALKSNLVSVDSLKEENERLEARIKSLEFDLKSQTALNENIAKEATALKVGRTDINQLKDTKNKLETRLKSLEFDLQSERTMHRNLLADLKSSLEAKDEELDMLRADIKEYKAEMSKNQIASSMSTDEAKATITQALGSKISKATYAERDDLKRIKGVGPFLEKKLHNLGIYTFKQISEMDNDLLSAVNDAIEFFPGRVIRDDWMGQAKALIGTKKVSPLAKYRPDDLTIVEGIGPKTDQILKSKGVRNWETLAQTSIAKLQTILDEAGKSFALSNPSTWPEQAKLAFEGKFEELEKLQDELDGGKRE